MFLAQGREANASQVAMVVMNTDGAVRAMVGGRNYLDSQFNRVTQAKRQPGSSFKAMVYLTAMEDGMTPDDTISGGAINVHGYRPHNYGGAHYGEMSLADAFARSVNTAAVRLITRVGEKPVVATAHRLGITSELHPNASLALGSSEVTPMELTSAYGAFASGGLKVTPYMVKQVRSVSGTILYQRGEPTADRVIEPPYVKEMDKMLRGVVAHGTGRAAALDDHTVGGKTGTSSDYHDAWFIGYSEDLIGSVWLGNDDSEPMNKITGGTIPAKLWRKVMTTAFDVEDRDKTKPEAPQQTPVAENQPAVQPAPQTHAVAQDTPPPAAPVSVPRIVAPAHVAEDKPINDEGYGLAFAAFARANETPGLSEKAVTATLNAHSLSLRGPVH
jgi:penicillin-binding protein 1A